MLRAVKKLFAEDVVQSSYSFKEKWLGRLPPPIDQSSLMFNSAIEF